MSKVRTTPGEGNCPVCGKYGNIEYRPGGKGLACTFRCWTDADFDADSNRLHEEQTEFDFSAGGGAPH